MAAGPGHTGSDTEVLDLESGIHIEAAWTQRSRKVTAWEWTARGDWKTGTVFRTPIAALVPGYDLIVSD